MNISPTPPEPSPIVAVLGALLWSICIWGNQNVIGYALAQVVNRRLDQVRWRLERLLMRFEAGKLRPWAPRAAKPAVVTAAAEAPGDDMAPKPARVTPAVVVPRRFGWLHTHLGYRVQPHCNQLQALLESARMIALLDAAPQAGRMLRPCCRMLALDTALLRLPRKVRVLKPRKPRVRKPSYIDVEYRPYEPGNHWVLRVNKWGMRYKKLKD